MRKYYKPCSIAEACKWAAFAVRDVTVGGSGFTKQTLVQALCWQGGGRRRRQRRRRRGGIPNYHDFKAACVDRCASNVA